MKTWEEVIKFHGHECPGLAIGYAVSKAAKEYLELDFSQDEEIVCVSENDACGLDAIQVMLGCTVGKGNLLIRLRGKSVYHFYNRKNNKSVRMCLKPKNNDLSREEYKNYLINSNPMELFDFSESNVELPEKARIFLSEVCEICGEKSSEQFTRLQEGKKVCLDCYSDYKRFF
ncbi:FmdE family protein [Romboutsia lituseburensis]|uniref:Formylmethanofuran dehydrogenase subunit E n=1 Tax=Romboutsia lituseburensis DSM 797 TaxID=1121325 RepID=A0A1G9MPE5_9FIRM|nr:FmdE family protein [Romboutsia lituseburensis]SDL76138.1 formylmethanofuran dehydrogenase subunit E [Romboutsia lituseburensis DSM 797]